MMQVKSSGILFLLILLACGWQAAGAGNAIGELKLMSNDEVKRIQSAWQSKNGADYQVLASIVRNAGQIIKNPVVFPPRGGQHNQWYQCAKCESPLKTLSPEQHQCTVCMKIYAGYPYDDCIYTRNHDKNLGSMLICARAYLATGDRKFAEYAKTILLGYAECYGKYAHHDNKAGAKPELTSKSGAHIYEQTLNEAVAAASRIGPAYDMIRNSDALTPDEQQKIKNGLIIPLLQNLDCNKVGKNNWQTWHNAAMLTLGVAFALPEWTGKALDDPGNGFYFQMKTSVTADGLWYEGSMSYHYYALSGLALTAQSAQAAGIDLWHNPQLVKMLKVPALYAMPDGTLPRFADSVNSRPRLPSAIGEPAWATLHDPVIYSILPAEASWESIQFGRNPLEAMNIAKTALSSVVFRDAGHAILRSNGPKQLAAVLSFAPYRGFHSHFDMLSFVFFGLGQEICVDPGRATSQAYRLPIHKFWYKGTISHNAVLTNFKQQKEAESSKLLFFNPGGACPAAAAETNGTYPGVSHIRLLALNQDYLLVVDVLNSKSPDTFAWVCHFEADSMSSTTPMTGVDISKLGHGFDYIKNAAKGSSAGMAKFEFVQKSFKTCLNVAAKGQLNFLTGDGPKENIKKRCPMIIVSNADKSSFICFAATLEPLKGNEKPTIEKIEMDESNGLLTIKVFRTTGADVFKYDKKTKLSMTFSK